MKIANVVLNDFTRDNRVMKTSIALVEAGHEVTVVCYAHGDGELDSSYRVVRTPDVPGYNNLRAGPDWVKPFLDLALAVKIASIPSDIVHAHNYEAPVAAFIAQRFTGTPIVYSAHNTMREELPTYFAGPVAQRVARRAGALLDRTVPRMSEHAVVLAEETKAKLHSLGCREVTTVAPGVDFDELDGVVPASLPEGPWVVYAGNPDAYQDLPVLMAAMSQLDGVGLLMVSASPLDEWANLGLPKFKAVQTNNFDEVKRLVAAADVAAIPRTTCSGFPIKLLNTLGLGVPTVIAQGSARGLPGEVVVPNGDAKAMASAIRELLDAPEQRRALGARARLYVRRACTWDARAAELEAIYARIVQQ